MCKLSLLLDTPDVQGGQDTFQAGNKIWQYYLSGAHFAGIKYLQD